MEILCNVLQKRRELFTLNIHSAWKWSVDIKSNSIFLIHSFTTQKVNNKEPTVFSVSLMNCWQVIWHICSGLCHKLHLWSTIWLRPASGLILQGTEAFCRVLSLSVTCPEADRVIQLLLYEKAQSCSGLAARHQPGYRKSLLTEVFSSELSLQLPSASKQHRFVLFAVRLYKYLAIWNL